jgi:hypothetical protein
MSPLSQMPADTGAIGTCYPTDQLMHRVSDRFVQQPPSDSEAALRLQERGRSSSELAPRPSMTGLPLRLAEEKPRRHHPGSLLKIVQNAMTC